MKFIATIPTKSSFDNQGIVIKVAREGERWERGQLGKFAHRQGVYVHLSNRKILYIGKTTKEKKVEGKLHWDNFGERMRREFQFSSSSNSTLYQALCTKRTIKTVMFDLDKIDSLIKGKRISPHRKALIFEQILIALLGPETNRI